MIKYTQYKFFHLGGQRQISERQDAFEQSNAQEVSICG